MLFSVRWIGINWVVGVVVTIIVVVLVEHLVGRVCMCTSGQ